MAKRTATLDDVSKAVVALTHRVRFLEHALRDARQIPSRLHTIAERRDRAEQNARDEAFKELDRQEKLEMYRKTPGLADRMREIEHRRNAFLKSRGLKPEPTRIPKELRKRR